MLDETRIRLKSRRGKMFACDGAQRALPETGPEFVSACPIADDSGTLLARMARRPRALLPPPVCGLRRECGRNLYRNMSGSARLISITGNGSVPGAGG